MSSDSEESVESNEPSEMITEQERNSIREKISTLSFEDLLKMKEELGSKVYNETVFGKNESQRKGQVKRANKNRPREISSKLPFKKTRMNQLIEGKKSFHEILDLILCVVALITKYSSQIISSYMKFV